MPLLHRKPFVRQKPPPDLRPDEEVFYCKVTNEIFRHYDDFFERTILCNSLVWSCAVTGRPGLTYQEALESEKKARQNLQSFPEPLIIPVLYLTSLTHRSRLHEICDDIFAYVKDRYFVEETVEVIRNNGARLQCRILEVLPPSHQNGFANGHDSNVDGETIIISDSDDSETQNSSFQNGCQGFHFTWIHNQQPWKQQSGKQKMHCIGQICYKKTSLSVEKQRCHLEN